MWSLCILTFLTGTLSICSAEPFRTLALPPFLPPLGVLEELLTLVHSNNVFTFNGEFSQDHGVAMGTKLTLALATQFLSYMEMDFIASSPHKPKLWRHYIDDIFCIWTHSLERFNDFLLYLNSLKPRLKFTAPIEEYAVTFLDLTIYKGNSFAATGILDTVIYYKPTNLFAYVHGSSNHPRQGMTFVDPMLPFGLRSAPKIFNAVVDAIQWCIEQQGVEHADH